ncbi:P-loop containing nucleoside triphosphate hydrolase protein [Xylaria cf. heliscus]|nr:P-loop containing nucleoside triphosphate hydrolase protein [Xylaria cf. heliscus]
MEHGTWVVGDGDGDGDGDAQQGNPAMQMQPGRLDEEGWAGLLVPAMAEAVGSSSITTTINPPNSNAFPGPAPVHPPIAMSSPPWNYIAKLVCIGDSGCGKSSLTIRLCEGRFTPQHDVTIGVEFGSRIVPVGPPHSKRASKYLSSPFDPENPPSTNLSGDGQNATSDEEQKHMKLSLWDTAGQEIYKSVTRSYFRGASGALLVFDITRRATFVHATDWLNDLRAIAEPDIVVILVGNKLDCVQSDGGASDNSDKREVTLAEAQEWAQKNGVLQYVETSAKSGENVEAAFMRVAERIFENINAGKYDLNDRRSGVKGPGPGTAATRGVKLSANDGKRSSGGGCC